MSHFLSLKSMYFMTFDGWELGVANMAHLRAGHRGGLQHCRLVWSGGGWGGSRHTFLAIKKVPISRLRTTVIRYSMEMVQW